MAPGRLLPCQPFWGRLGAILCALLLTACANAPLLLRPERSTITTFTLEGRVSVRRDARPYHAGLQWQHGMDRDEILLTGPLGQGLAELTRDTHGARLVTAEGQQYQAPHWTALADEVLGLSLPLDELPRWLTGRVSPKHRDNQGRPRFAESDGWQIDYLDYESARPDALPTMLELHREGIDVKLKIDQWQLP